MQASRCGTSRLDLILVQVKIAHSQRQVTLASEKERINDNSADAERRRLCIEFEADKANVVR
jgi:hypothetical protein